jgi:hypothetical protein
MLGNEAAKQQSARRHASKLIEPRIQHSGLLKRLLIEMEKREFSHRAGELRIQTKGSVEGDLRFIDIS